MANEKHKELASFVKSVHRSLKTRALEVGADEAWREHCLKKDVLQEYAISMQTLASKYWRENAEDKSKGAQCRIEWVVKKCVDYFIGGELEKRRGQENEKNHKLNCVKNEHNGRGVSNCVCNREQEGRKSIESCLTMLDVGSCYNPFKDYPFLKVVAIDLAPATPDVHCCDFLSLKIRDQEKGDYLEDLKIKINISELPSNAFDMIVFSLLLEYFPSPEQRYCCVSKAYQLLKPEGLLFIITPDSKHSSANAPLMKHWRIVLANMGFSRVYYEKLPHIHCMAYRKDLYLDIPQHWASINLTKLKYQVHMGVERLNISALYIPQDFQDISEVSDKCTAPKEKRTRDQEEILVNMFSELPEDFGCS